MQSYCIIKEMLEMQPGSGDEQAIMRRFEEEKAILARLSHPGLPRVRDFALVNGLCYIVSDFVEGTSLEQQLTDCLKQTGRPVPARELVPTILSVLEILDYLHSLTPPVLHRDVKPANILCEARSGSVMLVDLGLSHPLDARRTPSGANTLGYSPLEQIQGRPEPRSDLYALGATMSQMLSGQLPVPLGIPPLATLTSLVDPPLAALVDRACAFSLEHRFGSAREMRQALAAWLARATGEPLPAEEAQSTDSSSRRPRLAPVFPSKSGTVPTGRPQAVPPMPSTTPIARREFGRPAGEGGAFAPAQPQAPPAPVAQPAPAPPAAQAAPMPAAPPAAQAAPMPAAPPAAQAAPMPAAPPAAQAAPMPAAPPAAQAAPMPAAQAAPMPAAQAAPMPAAPPAAQAAPMPAAPPAAQAAPMPAAPPAAQVAPMPAAPPAAQAAPMPAAPPVAPAAAMVPPPIQPAPIPPASLAPPAATPPALAAQLPMAQPPGAPPVPSMGAVFPPAMGPMSPAPAWPTPPDTESPVTSPIPPKSEAVLPPLRPGPPPDTEGLDESLDAPMPPPLPPLNLPDSAARLEPSEVTLPSPVSHLATTRPAPPIPSLRPEAPEPAPMKLALERPDTAGWPPVSAPEPEPHLEPQAEVSEPEESAHEPSGGPETPPPFDPSLEPEEPSVPAAEKSAPREKKAGSRLPIPAILVAVLLVVVGGFFAGRHFNQGPQPAVSESPTASPSVEPSEEPSPTPAASASPEPLASASPEASPSPSASPEPVASVSPSASPEASPSPSASPEPVASASPGASPSPSASPSEVALQDADDDRETDPKASLPPPPTSQATADGGLKVESTEAGLSFEIPAGFEVRRNNWGNHSAELHFRKVEPWGEMRLRVKVQLGRSGSRMLKSYEQVLRGAWSSVTPRGLDEFALVGVDGRGMSWVGAHRRDDEHVVFATVTYSWVGTGAPTTGFEEAAGAIRSKLELPR